MIEEPSVLTSDYSTPPKRLTTASGRVSWFLAVIFASTIPSFKETRNSYHVWRQNANVALDTFQRRQNLRRQLAYVAGAEGEDQVPFANFC